MNYTIKMIEQIICFTVILLQLCSCACKIGVFVHLFISPSNYIIDEIFTWGFLTSWGKLFYTSKLVMSNMQNSPSCEKVNDKNKVNTTACNNPNRFFVASNSTRSIRIALLSYRHYNNLFHISTAFFLEKSFSFCSSSFWQCII